MTRLQRTLGGMRRMKRLPGAVFVVDPHREHIAVTEARKLEIPVIAIGDTNVDPDQIDYIIPANDDAIRAIRLLVRRSSPTPPVAGQRDRASRAEDRAERCRRRRCRGDRSDELMSAIAAGGTLTLRARAGRGRAAAGPCGARPGTQGSSRGRGGRGGARAAEIPAAAATPALDA